MEAMADFLFLGSKITVDSDNSHGIQRRLLLGRKPMINLDSVLKSRDITLTTKVHMVKVMVFLFLNMENCLRCFFFFPTVMYGCEGWTIKEAEHQRTDVFELWRWRNS